MTASPAGSASSSTGRLGLSLAGGGFRASLFHLGVLRRLAELDILRRLEVLSTVSGGSITGALYVLLLKKYLERARPEVTAAGELPAVRLTREQYVELVGELEGILVRGIQKNLRTRLLMNPLGTLLVLLTGDSLGRRMARLYERHLLRNVVEELNGIAPPPWWRPPRLWPGQMRMNELVVRPGGREISGGFAAYNARQRERGGSVVTSIVVNATSLNSGGRFYFSAVELGDWYLGYFRESEFDLLLARKALLALPDADLLAVAGGAPPPAVIVAVAPHDGRNPVAAAAGADSTYSWEEGEAARAAALALRRRGSPGQRVDDAWSALFAVPGFPGQLDDAAFGLLRRAKLAAWYIRVGSRRVARVLGGRTLAGHSSDMWSALRTIDPDVETHLRAAVANDAALLDVLADYLLELYWLRTAERVSSNIRDNWNSIRVGHAVGASACFPPVFPPFLVYGVYDDLHVPRLGLTDGGVYDNMGVTALLDEGCTEIIASDTSGLFNVTPVSTSGHIGLARRVPDLLMRALGGVQREGLRERRRVSRKLAELAATQDGPPTPLQEELAKFHAGRALDALVYFHIASPGVEPAEPGHADDAVPGLPGFGVEPLDIARLRTDLDGFGDVEVAALVNHGYDTADRYVRRYALDLVAPALRQTAPRAPRAFDGPNATRERATLILEIGSARFFRALKLRSPLAWGFTLLAVASVLALTWSRQWTIEGLLASGAALIQAEVAFVNRIARLVPGLADPASRSPGALAGMLALVAAAFLWSARQRPRRPGTHGARVSLKRVVSTARKWLRAFSGNVLWGLLGLPAIIAGVSSIIALISYCFFHLPFMRAVRIPHAARTRRDETGVRADPGSTVADEVAATPQDHTRGVPAGGG